MNDVSKISKWLREMDDKLSKTIKISHQQVLGIVVSELKEKYIFNIERNDKEWASAFEKVLRYYLEDDEIRAIKSRLLIDEQAENP